MKKLGSLILYCSILFIGGCALLPPIPNYKEQAKKKDELSSIQTQIAIQFLDVKQYRQAISAINQAINANDNNYNAWLVKGLIYQRLKSNTIARASYLKALSLAPNRSEVNNNYGWFICDSENHPELSIKYFDKALSDPAYPTPQVAYMNKGICEGRMGQFQKAATNLNQAYLVDPNFPTPIREMARLYLMQGDNHRANTLFNKYIGKVNKLDAKDLYLGWQIAQSLGNAQAAYEYEAQLRNNYPGSDEMQQIILGKAR